MIGNPPRWILAFDASCGTCRRISAAVAEASDGKLEVVPLERPDVQAWRAQAFGEEPKSVPTLLRVEDVGVRAWTGRAMAGPLTRRLGVRSTVRVLRALGRLRREALGKPDVSGAEPAGRTSMRRKDFLRLAGGTVVATGLVFTGRNPAFAAKEEAAADGWATKNGGRLPQRYDEVSRYPVAYRRAIFRASSPQVRSSLWVAHIDQYRAEHPGLSAEQLRLIGRVRAYFGREATFSEPRDPAVARQGDELWAETRRLFEPEQAYALVGMLGPSDWSAEHADASTRQPRNCAEPAVAAAAAPDCDCCDYAGQDWCAFRHGGDQLWRCYGAWGSCNRSRLGCGNGFSQPCTGNCVYGGLPC